MLIGTHSGKVVVVNILWVFLYLGDDQLSDRLVPNFFFRTDHANQIKFVRIHRLEPSSALLYTNKS